MLQPDVPADPPPVAACCSHPSRCPLTTGFSVGYWGGVTNYKGVLGTANAPRCYLTFVGMTPRPSEIPDCGEGEAVDTSAVNSALANPDVVAALAEAQDPLFGIDARAWDGNVWWFRRDDGHGLLVGNDCRKTPGCRDIPAGIAALNATLGLLGKQQSSLMCE